MINITLAGRLGGDATHRALDGGNEVTSFNMAVDQGFGDKKQTYWFSVSMWGKRGAALAPHLRKGSSATVTGEFSTREHEGKTYLQCRANDITLQGGKPSGDSGGSSYDERGGGGGAVDTDEIPFAAEWRL
jgi:single-strand DNA-binding protein